MPSRRPFDSAGADLPLSLEELRREFSPSRAFERSASPTAFPARSLSDENPSPRSAKGSGEAARGALQRASLASSHPSPPTQCREASADWGATRSKRSGCADRRRGSTPLRSRRQPQGRPVSAALSRGGGGGRAAAETSALPPACRWAALDVLLSEDVLRCLLSYCGPREAAAVSAVSVACRGALAVESLEPLWYAWWLERRFHFWPHTQAPPDALPCAFALGLFSSEARGASGEGARASQAERGTAASDEPSAPPSCFEDADVASPHPRRVPLHSLQGGGGQASSGEGTGEAHAGDVEEDLPSDASARGPHPLNSEDGLETAGCPRTTPPLSWGIGLHSGGVWRRQFLWSSRTQHNWSTGRCQRFLLQAGDHSLLSVALHPTYQSPLCSCHSLQSVFSTKLQRRRSRRSSAAGTELRGPGGSSPSRGDSAAAGDTPRGLSSELSCGQSGETSREFSAQETELSSALSSACDLPSLAAGVDEGMLHRVEATAKCASLSCSTVPEETRGDRGEKPWCPSPVDRLRQKSAEGRKSASSAGGRPGSRSRHRELCNDCSDEDTSGRAEYPNEGDTSPRLPDLGFRARFFYVEGGLGNVLEQRTCFFTASPDRVALHEHMPSSSGGALTSRADRHSQSDLRSSGKPEEKKGRSPMPSPSLGPRLHPDVLSKLLSSPCLPSTDAAPPASAREGAISDLDSYEMYLWSQTGCAPNNFKNRTSSAGGGLGARENSDSGASRSALSAFEGGGASSLLGPLHAGGSAGGGGGGRRNKMKNRRNGPSWRKASAEGPEESPALSPNEGAAARERQACCPTPPPFSLEPALHAEPASGAGREGRRSLDAPGEACVKASACGNLREKGNRQRSWTDLLSVSGGAANSRPASAGGWLAKGQRRSSASSSMHFAGAAASRPRVHDLSRFSRDGASLLSCRIHTETGRIACTLGVEGACDLGGGRVGRRRKKSGGGGNSGWSGSGGSPLCEGRVYDLHSGQLVCSLDIDGAGLHQLQFQYAFSDDAGLLFGFDRWHREFVCWNLAGLCEGQSRLDAAAVIVAHADGILAMDVAGRAPGPHSVTGDCRVLAGSRDDTISLYAVDPFVRLQTFAGHEGEVSAVRWLARTPCNEPDACGCICSRRQNADIFASGSYDALVKIWDVRQRAPASLHPERQLTLLEHHSRISSIAAAGPDQRTLLTGDTDGVVKLWDLRQCTKSVCTVQYDGPVIELHANAAFCLVCVSSRRGKDGVYVMDFSADLPV
ncbi:WD domain, G-beta repeat-containing protein [Besnoitia besnoiti]|uniref:WD domain, G-beta repeat-containing protein n=1 Tax=Besnoitia besnoiti TaxID=94643 RepID=A0A2A9MH14_BESBE|nr:WD domain, G-beta repeat-containing protein [Besnoitia besnoiti]PFH37818.1 WD domain, G-beta repeat-containing protein [Besnoitia besnoiti]